MMKMNKMPTIIALLVFSWLTAIFGLATGTYLIILKPGEIKSLLIAFSILLGSLILAAVIRTFGNIGQMIFDLKNFIFVFYHSVSNDLRASIQGLKELDRSLSRELQTLNQGLTALSQDTKEVRETLSQGLTALSQDTKEARETISQGLTALSQDTKEARETISQGFTALSQDTKEARETINHGLLDLTQDLKTQLQVQTTTISDDLQTLKNSLEQLNCDSKDVNQNIHQIKTFFEQIERHLDLKK